MKKYKLPHLHKGLTRLNNEEFMLSDYIFITKYIAVISRGSFKLFVDIKDYLQKFRDFELETDREYESALDVIEFLDNKYITADYWKELVEAENIIVKKDCLKVVKKGTLKELRMMPVITTSEGSMTEENYLRLLLDNLREIDTAKTNTSSIPHVPGIVMNIVLSVFSSMLNDDFIMTNNLIDNERVRFNFFNHHYIYGYFENNSEIDLALYNFLGVEEGVKALLGEFDIPDTPVHVLKNVDENKKE